MMTADEKRKMLARLKRIEGQVRGIAQMVEGDRYCVDTLLQLSAVQGAVAKASQVLLESHLKSCVQEAFRSSDELERARKVDELMEIFGRYGKVLGS